jgi:hypothetical protein
LCDNEARRRNPTGVVQSIVNFKVRRLKTEADIPEERQIYIEVETKTGTQQTGRLIKITEKDLVLSRGFYYSTVKDSTLRIENKITIPKQEILILKVW